ncbi:MAG: NAD(P)/FAD-dependent oxidoreductase [Peptococcaceae bacterium]|nr:NAD(P)/FAD-dependent oxidoreductase [Peptococcaceae bacterium]
MAYLIIGNGPAGVSAIERIREIDPQGKIMLVSRENNPPYSRIMTPEYMISEVDEENLFYRGTGFYERYSVETRLGCKVKAIVPEKKTVILENQEEIGYKRVLIASGSRPIVPSWADTGIKGVFTLWDKADSVVINQQLGETKEAVIIGGGLVGLQAARALSARKIKVTIIEKMKQLMPLQLDTIASSLLLQAVMKQGIDVHLDTEVLSLESQNGKITAVATKDQTIPADLVIVAIGAKPNLEMTVGTALERDKGLITNEYMQTNIPDIYAAGDVAQAYCRLTGEKTVRALWLSAVQQGKVAGANMAGRQERYLGSTAMNSIQLFGLSIISQGRIEALQETDEIILKYQDRGVYQKLVCEDGRLIGFILVGDVRQAGVLHYKLGQSLFSGYWGGFRIPDGYQVNPTF